MLGLGELVWRQNLDDFPIHKQAHHICDPLDLLYAVGDHHNCHPAVVLQLHQNILNVLG